MFYGIFKALFVTFLNYCYIALKDVEHVLQHMYIANSISSIIVLVPFKTFSTTANLAEYKAFIVQVQL